eukprot:GFYU01008967.1.p1 GENE.GFYU01008967.1~~GFYU01008967.1.p1  ORF type:complete len:497 (+),score=93.76 GFYU01008967.1:229-1719(+)
MLRRWTSGKKSDDKPKGPSTSFNVVKINSQGKRQTRKLILSGDGIRNMNGSNVQWHFTPPEVHRIYRDMVDSARFNIEVIHKYQFETDDDEQSGRIIDAFRLMNLVGPDGFREDEVHRTSSASISERERNQFARGDGEDQYRSRLKPTDFEQIKMIGAGSFGKVFLVRKMDSGSVYAMKVLSKTGLVKKDQVANAISERKALTSLRHPFIVQLYYSFQDEDNLYLVMEFARGGELFYHLQKAGKFDENIVRFYAAEIIVVLTYLHSRETIYRDLKLENIMLDEHGHIRVTDLGLAKEGHPVEDDGVMSTTFAGTPEYLAPEVLTGVGYGKAADWWSLGVATYEMLTGELPFLAETRAELYERVLDGDLTFPKHVSDEARDFVSSLLTRNPKDRLADHKVVMHHPFFRDVNWLNLASGCEEPPIKPVIKDEFDTSNFDGGEEGIHDLDIAARDIEADDDVSPMYAMDNVTGPFENFTWQHDSPIALASNTGADSLTK